MNRIHRFCSWYPCKIHYLWLETYLHNVSSVLTQLFDKHFQRLCSCCSFYATIAVLSSLYYVYRLQDRRTVWFACHHRQSFFVGPRSLSFHDCRVLIRDVMISGATYCVAELWWFAHAQWSAALRPVRAARQHVSRGRTACDVSLVGPWYFITSRTEDAKIIVFNNTPWNTPRPFHLG